MRDDRPRQCLAADAATLTRSQTAYRAMTPLLGLARFASPLDADWEARAIDRFTSSEQQRLARIQRPLRRTQFIVGHRLLRWLLCSVGLDKTPVEIAADGALRRPLAASIFASIAHSQNVVAAVIADAAIGVDVEAPRLLRDPAAAAALLGTDPEASGSCDVLRHWVMKEAILKSGNTADSAWVACWADCQLAVSGVVNPPLTRVFELAGGTYNAIEVQWRRHDRRS